MVESDADRDATVGADTSLTSTSSSDEAASPLKVAEVSEPTELPSWLTPAPMQPIGVEEVSDT